MDIKTKFSLNDRVWMMDNNQALEWIIQTIHIKCFYIEDDRNPIVKIEIIYFLFNIEKSKEVNRKEDYKGMFSTKKELINSL
jgi:hypothetical protein